MHQRWTPALSYRSDPGLARPHMHGLGKTIFKLFYPGLIFSPRLAKQLHAQLTCKMAARTLRIGESYL